MFNVLCWPLVEDSDQNVCEACLNIVVSLDSVQCCMAGGIFIL